MSPGRLLKLTAIAALASLLLPVFGARAATAPAGNISANIEFLSQVLLPVAGQPYPGGAYSIAFIDKYAFVSGVGGLYSVDISDPSNPKVVGVLPHYIYENEHMTSDPKRHLIFVSRDPRGFTGPLAVGPPTSTYFPYGAVHVFDVSNPAVFNEVGFHLTPAGHTATCINDCHFLWLGGPRVAAAATPGVQPVVGPGADPSWSGRPIWSVDVSDPTNIKDCPHWIDLGNNDGTTDYSHDIDVDANGVAWVSGASHLRGFWTQGEHLDPTTGKVATATACDPIPYAGGGTNEGQIAAGAVIHNSGHNLSESVDGRQGDVLTATEENTVTDCKISGRFLTYDIGSSYDGEGWINTATTHFRLRKLDAWWPQNQPGSTGCDSAHWFTERGDGLIAIAFYSQGTRILDPRDPYHIKQVGYYNPTGNNTWASYWRPGNLIVTADASRGVDILRFHDSAAAAVAAPVPGPAGTSTPLPNTGRGANPLLIALTIGALAALIPLRRIRRCV